MQQWEYLMIHCYDNVVIWAGEKRYANLNYNKAKIMYEIDLGGKPRVGLGDLLNEIGKDGWEVVGMASTEDTGQSWRVVPMTIIAKRPIPA